MGKPGIIANIQEGNDQVTITFKQKSLRYLDEALQLNCFKDMLDMELFPNAKEITESFAAYEAVRKYCWPRVNPSDPNVVLVAVGDGSSPRTAATFAYRTRWQCFSIDPQLGNKTKWNEIQRLKLYKNKIEEHIPKDFGITRDTVVVLVLVHSHADIEQSVKRVMPCKNLNIIAMPCCFPQTLEYTLTDMYDDWGVHSPHRTVKVWTNIKPWEGEYGK